MVAITSLVTVVATFAAFAMPLGVNGETAEVSQIQKDINALSKNMHALSDAVDSFQTTGGTVLQLLPVAMKAASAGASLNQLATDVGDAEGPMDNSDAETILAAVQALEPVIMKVLDDVAVKKDALEALLPGPVGTLIVDKTVTTVLEEVTALFNLVVDGLDSLAPDSFDSQLAAIGIQTTIASGLDNAMSAFSN